MIQVIAEASDKIPSVWSYWIVGAFLAACAFSFSYAFKPLGIVGVAAGLLGLLLCCSEFTGGDGFAIAVRKEMGRFYVFSAAFIPGVLVILGAVAGSMTPRSRSAGLGFCACGYNLRGNISGICPECGKSTPRNLPAANS